MEAPTTDPKRRPIANIARYPSNHSGSGASVGSQLHRPQRTTMKPSLLRDILAIVAASAYVLIFLNIGNLLYGEIQTVAARLVGQAAIQVPVADAIQAMAYTVGALMVGLITGRRGFIYGAAVPAVVQISIYIWYGPMGHTNIPPELRERYPYPFWLYLFPILGWLIPTGIGGFAGVLLAKRGMEGVERNHRTFLLAAILLSPQIAAWCYVTHAIMWGSASYPVQAIEFVPATLAFLLIGHASIRSIVKLNSPLQWTT